MKIDGKRNGKKEKKKETERKNVVRVPAFAYWNSLTSHICLTQKKDVLQSKEYETQEENENEKVSENRKSMYLQ